MDRAEPDAPTAQATFGALLRQYRLAAGLSQEELAERAGLSVAGLSALETGRRQAPYRHTVTLLVRALRLTEAETTVLEAAVVRVRAPAAATGSAPGAPDQENTPEQEIGWDTSPALPAAQPARTNLPAPLTSLIGREREQGEVQALLATARLVTLTGAGGAGKTRLALAVADVVRSDYPDGAWLVELASLADPGLVPSAVTQALGLREEPQRPILATLLDHLKQKRLLLVLDNCEHLVVACAELAEALLRGCAQLRILATSREGLGIAGERLYRVPSLAVPSLDRLPALDRLREYAAIALFVRRAQERRAGFTLTAQNARAVAQVCARLDGMPLAIELAAARVGSLPVESIAARLDDRFRLLTAGSRTALPRQQTLRAALDWSYDLLGEGEQRLLDRLSVFAGGCTLEAAEAVCAGPGVEAWEVLDLLGSLVNKSLVLLEDGGTEEEQGRYRLLETVRQYGWERLAADGETADVRDRHLAWCLALAEEAAPALSGPEQMRWLDQLEVEHDNLRAGLRWARERGAAEAGLRLAAAVWRFWWTRGYLGEGRRWLEGALAGDDGSAPLARVRALTVAAQLTAVHGDTARALTLLDESLARARDYGDRQSVARSLSIQGFVVGWKGDLARAEALFEEALAIARVLGDHHEIPFALFGLGDTAYALGDLARAATSYEEALALLRELGDWPQVGIVLSNLGVMSYTQGNPARAAMLFEKALAIYHRVGERWHIIMTTGHLADVALGQGDLRRGAALYAECLALARAAGMQPQSARGLEGLAYVAMQASPAGDPGLAARLLGAAAALAAGGWTPMRIESDRMGRILAATRVALGEAAFAAAWAEGRALSLDAAVDLALESITAVLHGE
jgi:predicted ATPase/transcriptional regulator with XRE-family HTH domain